MRQSTSGKPIRKRFFYGWWVVLAGAMMFSVNALLVSSYGVFFKPLVAEFGWSRGLTSGVQSTLFITLAACSVVVGWLADLLGHSKTLVVCGILLGAGLLLTSQVSQIWQIYLSYSVLTAIGMSACFSFTMTLTARWFVKRRGVALGIVSAGGSMATMVGVPAVAHLIETIGWSRTYFIIGLIAPVVILTGAWIVRRNPEQMGLKPYGLGEEASGSASSINSTGTAQPVSFRCAARTNTLWLLFAVFLLFGFCQQMISVHLVNYATDMRIAAIEAATLMSIIGLAGFVARLVMGAASDKIGSLKVVMIGGLAMCLSLIWINFASVYWMLAVFALCFGFGYGSEVPQQAHIIGHYYGLRISIVALTHAGGQIGSALGSWTGGIIFDITKSYHIAFTVAAVSIFCSVVIALFLRSHRPVIGTDPAPQTGL